MAKGYNKKIDDDDVDTDDSLSFSYLSSSGSTNYLSWKPSYEDLVFFHLPNTLSNSEFYPGRPMTEPLPPPPCPCSASPPPPIPPPRPLSVIPSFMIDKRVKRPKSEVLIIGIIGLTLSIAGIIAYGIMQIPALRKSLDSYPDNIYLSSSDEVVKGVLTPAQLFYGIEVTVVVVGTILGLIVNSLLLYGTSRSAPYFLLPWLVFHPLVILVCFVATILVLALVIPMRMKAIAIVPFLVAIVIALLWAKVYNYYKWSLKKQRKMQSVQDLFSAYVDDDSLMQRANFDSSESTYRNLSEL